MSALASNFKCHLQLARTILSHGVSSCRTIQHLPSAHTLADVDAFQLKVEERNERKEDADGRRLSRCCEGLVELNSGLLNVAAENPASLASFETAVVVELAGENPVGLADESVLGTFDEVTAVVCYFALELFDTSCAPLLRQGGR
eukprot:5596483-Pleurochrysis_carterae.AAC.1